MAHTPLQQPHVHLQADQQHRKHQQPEAQKRSLPARCSQPQPCVDYTKALGRDKCKCPDAAGLRKLCQAGVRTGPNAVLLSPLCSWLSPSTQQRPCRG